MFKLPNRAIHWLQKDWEAVKVCPLPWKACRAWPGWTAEGGCPYMSISGLRGFAWGFSFQRLVAANVHLDLLRLGFSLLGQSDLQHPLVVVRRNLLGVHGCGQSESAGEAAILTLHAPIILFFLFLLDLALAVNGEGIVLQANVDVFLADPRTFDLQSNVVLVFVNVNGGGEAGCGQGLIPAAFVIRLAEKAVHTVLQRRKLAERLPTGKYGHSFLLLCFI